MEDVEITYVLRYVHFGFCLISALFSSLQDFASRAKLAVQNLVQKVGFFGILACASVSSFQ